MQTRLARALALRLSWLAVICAFTLSVLRSGFASPRAAAEIIIRVFRTTFPWRLVNHGHARRHARVLFQHGAVARALTGSPPTSARREGTRKHTAHWLHWYRAALLCYYIIVLRYRDARDRCHRQVCKPRTFIMCARKQCDWVYNLKYNKVLHEYSIHMRLPILIKELHMPQNIFKHVK